MNNFTMFKLFHDELINNFIKFELNHEKLNFSNFFAFFHDHSRNLKLFVMQNSFDFKSSKNYLKRNNYKINIKFKSQNADLKTILINNIMIYNKSKKKKSKK